MYCQKCGKQIDDGSDFCKYCGSKINGRGGKTGRTDFAALP